MEKKEVFKMKLALDIFCGSGSFGNVAKEFGFEVISIDNRRRKGVCEPTIKADFKKISHHSLFLLLPEISWYAIPCDIWSNASGGHHLDDKFKAKTEKARKHIELLYHVLRHISENGGYWVIENPRGKLEKFPPFIDFLNRNDGKIHHCTL